ncbi:MAG: NADH-quinone oxidoreductase subunit NuoH [Alphaproteobacteria bacterium]|nr:NADH-quinone oxidoreductase subunit NuoH [Alphaproteobacteria bacterium]
MTEFWTDYLFPLFIILGKILLIAVPLILAMAYLTYAERKVLAAMQLRQGPMTVGPFGLLQPIADGIKLLSKETIIPSGANKMLFLLAPMLTFSMALVAWAVIPFAPGWVLADINVGVLYLFAISSLGVYGILMAGWASNSRYAFLGGLRSAAQMVSYEVSIGLVIICVILCVGSFRLTDIVEMHRPWWMTILLFPMLIIFFISALAETNRSPFDLPEGESEIVGGYNVEYSSMTFALFFLGEYMNMILMSAMATILFLGGWNPPFGLEWAGWNWLHPFVWFVLKICLVLFCFIWSRGTLPRFRYDQLMRLGWKIFLPFSVFYVVFIAGILLYTGNLPNIADGVK